jgi:hypothetical protein
VAFELITNVAGPYFKRLGKWLGEKLGDVWDGFKEKVAEKFSFANLFFYKEGASEEEKYNETLPEYYNILTLDKIFKGLGDKIYEFIGGKSKYSVKSRTEEGISSAIGGAGKSFNSGMKDVNKTVEKSFETSGRLVYDTITGKVSTETRKGITSWGGIVDKQFWLEANKSNTSVGKAYSKVPGAVGKALAPTDQKITSWGNTTKQSMNSAALNATTTAAATFGGLPATIASKLVGVGSSVASTISKSFSGNKTSFTNTATTVGNYFKPISSNILKNSTVSGSAISGKLDSLVNEYKQRTPSRISQIAGVFSPLRSSILGKMDIPGDSVSKRLDNLSSEYKNRTPKRLDLIAGNFSTLPEKIMSKVNVKGSDISSWADMTKNNFATRIVGTDGNGGIVSKIVGNFSGVPWGIMQQIDKKWWFDDFQTNATSYINRKGTEIPNAIIGQFDVRGRAYTTGQYVAEGFANGTGSWWSLDTVKKKAVEMASTFMTSVNKFFGVNSPAKLTMETGRYVGLGFLVGWESTFGEIMNSVTTFGNRFSSVEIAAPTLNTSGLASLSDAGINATATVGLDIESLHDAVVSGVEIALSGQQERPIYVNAELRTQNDEVLARAVTRGQRSIAYRTNPNAPVY